MRQLTRVAFLASLLAPSLLAQPAPPGRLALYPCAISGLYVADCGYLTVYENRSAHRGKMLGLRVIRLPALDSAAPRRTLVVFAGGPGSSATAAAQSYLEQFAGIRRTHEIVVMDQRGAGESNPLMCEFPNARLATVALLSLAWPDSLVDRCRHDSGSRGDLAQYTTTVTVGDYEDLRLALGVDKVDVYGASYGTRAAQEYARRYPNAIRTLTLRSIIPPSAVLFRDNSRGIERSLARLYAACRADFKCNWSRGDLPGQLRELLARLGERPGTIRVRGWRGDLDTLVPFNRDMYVGALRRMLSNADSWPLLPDAIDRPIKDSFVPLSPGIGGTTALERSQTQGLFWNITCAEDAPRVTPAALQAATANMSMRTEMVANVHRICARWGPAPPVPADFYEPLRIAAPTLLLSGADDPVTPPAYGDEVLKSLSNARHLVFEASSHTPFNACQQKIAAEFITNARVATLDTTCMSTLVHPPFRYQQPWWMPFDW